MTISGRSRPLMPFICDPGMQSLTQQYPEAVAFVSILRVADDRDRRAAVRLWLSEGIPFRFRDQPILYEAIRDWLGYRLGVHAKEITLIGSSRIGFSLAPQPDLGKRLSEESDLDFSVVSEQLFARLVETFESWAQDFDEAVVVPRGPTEAKFWHGNLAFGRRNIPKGFMDPSKVPTWERYPLAMSIAQAMWALGKKLQLTAGSPQQPIASLRVYCNWHSFVTRLTYNLKTALG